MYIDNLIFYILIYTIKKIIFVLHYKNINRNIIQYVPTYCTYSCNNLTNYTSLL